MSRVEIQITTEGLPAWVEKAVAVTVAGSLAQFVSLPESGNEWDNITIHGKEGVERASKKLGGFSIDELSVNY